MRYIGLYLPTYIRSTQVEEVTLLFMCPDKGIEVAAARDRWSTLDEMIVEALHASPRRKFTLHLYIPLLTKPVGEERAVSFLPRCNELELLNFVYHEDVARRNQAMVSRPVLSEWLEHPAYVQ